VGCAIWLHAAGGRNLVFLAQGGKTSDEPLQVFHREILGQAINIFLARIHPKGVFASL
jgi:hypothetical protein